MFLTMKYKYKLSYKEIVLVVVQNTDTISILSDTIKKYILWRN